MKVTLRATGLVAAVAAIIVMQANAVIETKAVQTSAKILLTLNHFPSDAEKKTLQAIVDDKTTTAPERTVTQALINVVHTVSAGDKPKLEALVKAKETPESVRTLANVILTLNHTPSAADKEKLKKLAWRVRAGRSEDRPLHYLTPAYRRCARRRGRCLRFAIAM